MSTKPCLFGVPLTPAQRQKRWRDAHPETRKQRTLWMQEWRERKHMEQLKEEEMERMLVGVKDRGAFFRQAYETAVLWYKQEGSVKAHEAVLKWWQRWADYAAQNHPPRS